MPEELLLRKVITGGNGRIINYDHRRSFQPLAEESEAVDHGLGINGALKGKRMKLVSQVKKAQDVLARTMGGRQFQGLPHFLPGVRDTRSEGEARFIEIPEIKLARWL